MALLIMISFLIIAGHSNARLLMKNNLLIAPDTLSAFHPNPNALFDDDSRLHTAEGHMEKAAVEHVEEIISSSSANSATNEEALSLGLTPSITNNYQGESSASNKAMVGNLIVTEQQLSTSSSSPGTDQMHNSLTRNVDKSRHSSGDEDLQPEKSNKRKLGSTSTPSPGGGH